MRVLFVASEAYPLAKTGGLGDVGRGLPTALMHEGLDVRLLLPAYPSALERLVGGRVAATLDGVMGVPVGRLLFGRLPDSGVPTWLVDAPSLYDRPGGPYLDEHGRDWSDNALRFAYLSHVAALIGVGLASDWRPDVVHCNDWQTGLAPLMMAASGRRRPATVFTIHNLAFRGIFPMQTARELGLTEEHLTIDGCEFYGQASFLKAGVNYADRITTVSPTYAREILTPEFGHGLDGLLRHRSARLSGILNGVEEGLWTPRTDACLPAAFDAHDISGKRACKAELQRALGLPVQPDAPLYGFVSRLTEQKMADVLLETLPWFAANGAQFVLAARGDPSLEAGFAHAARELAGVSVRIGYEETLAHRIFAGVDIVLSPARFEPCGLTQLYAMRYGSPPIVRRTGGLADTVVDASPAAMARGTATGFSFDPASAEGLVGAMARAAELYRQPLAWRRLQLNAMARDFTWRASAQAYGALYEGLVGRAEPRVVARPARTTTPSEVAAAS